MNRIKRTTISTSQLAFEDKQIKKVIGYVRVSTDSQADTGHSIDSQKEQIRNYTHVKGWELIEIIEDNGVSGTINPNERIGFKQVLAALNGGKANALLVCKNDRLARRASYQKEIIYSLTESNIEYISIAENIDTATASGKLFLSMLAEFAEYEVELIRERTRTAIKHLKDNGQVHNQALFGYQKETTTVNGKAAKVWISNEAEQAIIKSTIALYNSGLSWRAVSSEIEKQFGKKIQANTLRRIFIREGKRVA